MRTPTSRCCVSWSTPMPRLRTETSLPTRGRSCSAATTATTISTARSTWHRVSTMRTASRSSSLSHTSCSTAWALCAVSSSSRYRGRIPPTTRRICGMNTCPSACSRHRRSPCRWSSYSTATAMIRARRQRRVASWSLPPRRALPWRSWSGRAAGATAPWGLTA